MVHSNNMHFHAHAHFPCFHVARILKVLDTLKCALCENCHTWPLNKFHVILRILLNKYFGNSTSPTCKVNFSCTQTSHLWSLCGVNKFYGCLLLLPLAHWCCLHVVNLIYSTIPNKLYRLLNFCACLRLLSKEQNDFNDPFV